MGLLPTRLKGKTKVPGKLKLLDRQTHRLPRGGTDLISISTSQVNRPLLLSNPTSPIAGDSSSADIGLVFVVQPLLGRLGVSSCELHNACRVKSFHLRQLALE